MPQNEANLSNRMVLEVYFEDKKGHRITQWFEFKAADNKITVKPIEENAQTDADPHLRLSYNESTGFQNRDPGSQHLGYIPDGSRQALPGKSRMAGGPTTSNVQEPNVPSTRPFDLDREVSMVAPGCTRSQCLRCSNPMVKRPGGSRAASYVNLGLQRRDDGPGSGTSSSNVPLDGTAEELSAAREDMISEWLSNQLCLTRMKLKVILAFKKIVERRNNELDITSSSHGAADPRNPQGKYR